MTRILRELCADAAAQALPGERVEVFARRTRTAMTRLSSNQGTHDQVADGWLIGVRSIVGNEYGSASTNLPDPASLRATLASAREIRRFAPRAWHGVSAAGTAGPGAADQDGAAEDEPCPGRLAALRRLAQEALRADGVEPPITITAGSTVRTVARCDSAGWSAAFSQSEAQLHIRSAAPGLDAAQGARIRPSAGELPIGQVAAEYSRCLQDLSGATISVRAVDWLALSPLVVARILSRLSRGFLRVPLRRPAMERGRLLGSHVVTLIDDGTVGGGPAGSPFDDEGTPRRRNVLLREGKVETLLGSVESGPTTGNAAWTGWNSEMAVATTNCFLEPTCNEAAIGPVGMPGTGFIAQDVRGFRSGIDLTSAHLEFELAGAITRAGQQMGSARLSVSVTPDQFLKNFIKVLPGIEFYRITGIYGGSWCLTDGSLVRNDR